MERKKSWIKSNFQGIFFTILIAIFFRSFVFEPFHIPSGSMKPNLLQGDYVFVNKMAYGYSRYSIPFHPRFLDIHLFRKKPERGDVVVFVPPNHEDLYYVKRVVGLPGDIVKIRDSHIYVNDKLLNNDLDGEFFDSSTGKNFKKFKEDNLLKKYDVLYIEDKVSMNDFEYEVPNDSLFVMGDNRDNSMDSRFLDVGYIPLNNLVGRVSFIGFSLAEGDISRDYNQDLFMKILGFFRFNRFFSAVR